MLLNRFQIMADYCRGVILPVLEEERRQSDENKRDLLSAHAKTLLVRETSLIDGEGQEKLARVLETSGDFADGVSIPSQTAGHLGKEYCDPSRAGRCVAGLVSSAESAGIRALQEFVARLKGYVPSSSQG